MKRLSLLLGLLLSLSAMAVEPVISNGLLARFDFSKVSDKTVTDAVAGIEATLGGQASVKTIGSYSVLELNAANCWLDMTAATGALIKGKANFSISVFYRVKENQYITTAGNFLWNISSLSACTATEGLYNSYRVNTQHLAVSTGGYNNETIIERGVVSERGRWVSVVYTQTGTTGRLYIDGALVGTNKMPSMMTLFSNSKGNPDYCWLGRSPFSGDIYLKNTLITEFCLYNRALTAADVSKLAAQTALLDDAYQHEGTPGDNTALLNEIATAEALLAQADDSYAPGAIAELSDLIQVARHTAADTGYIQAVYTTMVTRLKAAEASFNNAKGYTPLTAQTAISGDRGFRHPGLLHTDADFQRIKQQIADNDSRVVAAYNVLKTAEYAQATVQTYPVETIVRGGGVGENYINAARGATMAYQNALRWKIDGTKANADAAVRILMAWARTTKAIGGDTNYALAAGLYGYAFANAAELMRDYEGWSRSDFAEFQRWMLDVWYPSSIGFLRRRNGTWENSGGQGGGRPGHYWSNWGLCNAINVMSIGILCDDVFIYNQGLSYYKYDQVGTYTAQRGTTINNDGLNEFLGNLVPIVVEDARGPFGYLGQMQESGRDQGHTAMSVGLAVDLCQTALNQGDDLYRYMDDRLAAGIEYVAAYNNANINDLPWTQYHYCDCRTAWHNGDWQNTISSDSRGNTRPYWGRVLGYYEGIRGVKMQYSEKASQDMGIDGGGKGSVSGGYDHMGYSVLTCTRPFATKVPTALKPQIVVDGNTIDGNELGGLTNTYVTTATTAIQPGTPLTLKVSLPDGEQDTGQWKWDSGETTSSISIVANESRVYRVTYTNADGIVSEQAFTIAVAGSCHDMLSEGHIYLDGQLRDGQTLEVPYGKSVTLTLSGNDGFGCYYWDNGKTTQSITLPAVATSRDVTGWYLNQGGLVSQFTFHITVTNVPSSGISEATVGNNRAAATSSRVYSLTGVQRPALRKGLNIVDGKKIIVR